MGIGELKPTEMILKLADRSTIPLVGYIEDIPVKIEGIYITTDFVVVDIEEDHDVPIVLGRPFLATAGAIIDVQSGRIVFQLQAKRGNPRRLYQKLLKNLNQSLRSRKKSKKSPKLNFIESTLPEIQEEVADLGPVEVLSTRTRGGSSGAASQPKPKVHKKGKKQIRKLKMSKYT
ncbi:uncharacterized protein [Medicago truncatula]|uniref:uncharacterized protein n=1 Tax=Medicago truncatula TaxID=3880 RepID=UPI0019682887|nr:uncharacterized protein LOC120577004 [Medicago truncatula]